jgi:hypothetical protein
MESYFGDQIMFLAFLFEEYMPYASYFVKTKNVANGN